MDAKSLYSSEDTRPRSEAKEVALWQERISIAKKAQDQWAEDSGAKRFEKEYKGDYGIVFNARTKKVPVPPHNEVFAYVQADLSTTYNRDPYISINAKAGTPRGAALWEVIINYDWREQKIKEEIEYEIIDKDLIGYAWHKVGYDPVTDRTFSKWLSWKDVLWNIGSKRPPVDCQWMAQRIVMPLEDIKAKFKAAQGLEGVPDPCVDEEQYKRSAYKDDIKVGVMWEIWDLRGKQKLMVAEGLKERFLDVPTPWPDYLKEFPFLMYWDFAVPGSSRPMSAIAPWEAQILEEMVLMGSAINHAKRWNRQVFVNGATFEENVLDKYERGDDGAILTVSGKVGPEDLRFVDYGQLPVDFYLLMDRLQALKRNINGQPEFVRGGVTKTGTRTVGELQMMQQGNRSRQDRKIDRLETHLENIARHMMAQRKANFDFDQVLKITGELPEEIIAALGPNFNPETKEVTFSADDIEGEYDAEVKAGSTLPLDKQTRMQIHEIILNAVAPVIAQGIDSPFLFTLIKGMLHDYDVKELEEAYQAEVERAAQAKQEAAGQQDVESEKVMAEAGKRQAQSQLIQAETAITAQDASIGPEGRALMERLKKPEPRPVANGASR